MSYFSWEVHPNWPTFVQVKEARTNLIMPVKAFTQYAVYVTTYGLLSGTVWSSDILYFTTEPSCKYIPINKHYSTLVLPFMSAIMHFVLSIYN